MLTPYIIFKALKKLKHFARHFYILKILKNMLNRLNLDKIKKKNTFFSILNIQSGAGEGT